MGLRESDHARACSSILESEPLRFMCDLVANASNDMHVATELGTQNSQSIRYVDLRAKRAERRHRAVEERIRPDELGTRRASISS